MTRIGTFLVVLVALGLPVPAQQQTIGLFVNDDPSPGYTLFSPIGTETTYLINNDGLLVNSWTGPTRPGLMAYLTPNGTLMRTGRVNPGSFPTASGAAGILEEYDWDGNLIWEYEYFSPTFLSHHDVEQMPNGNWLIIAWDLMTVADAILEGKAPLGGTIVWEWHARDHLVQEFDVTKNNFGFISGSPELIDFNYSERRDLIHANGIDYNADLDQIVISAHAYSELWVIDHSTTTAEAAGHTGGNSGMGGDLMYRWGNPLTYQQGLAADQQLFTQHDTQWIDPGLPGAGNMLVFNNNPDGPVNFSNVLEIVPPVDMNGNYPLAPSSAHGPASELWKYEAVPPEDFYGSNTSGAFRLPNNNTLITVGPMGRMFEVETDGTLTWEYQNPATGPGILTQGDALSNSGVFKARRYAPDYPGFAGKDLTPGDPIEMFTRPLPPDSQSLRVDKQGAGAFRMGLTWADGGCASFDYHVLYGDLSNVSASTVDDALCDIGTSGSYTWQATPTNSIFFMLVGTDITGVYESSWGPATGAPRGGTKASQQCGTTTKVLDPQCP
jgi:hypothetical protein